MSNITCSVRIDEDLKSEAEELFDDLGLSLSVAINIFLRQAVREGRIPFEVTKTPRSLLAEREVTES